MLTKDEIGKALERWYSAWNEHDLDGVMDLFHDDVVFESWAGGRISGKASLRRAWSEWFAHHGDFRFTGIETFIDETGQKALFHWRLDWPSTEEGYNGEPECRYGVDILHFDDGKIIRKLTFSKTAVEIGGKTIRLTADER